MISAAVMKILKPIGAGLALAYLATALVDGPAPVNFRPENPYAAKQAEILEPQAALVIEKNIMKLGSLLSVPEGDLVLPGTTLNSGDKIEVLPEMRATPGVGSSVTGEVTGPTF